MRQTNETLHRMDSVINHPVAIVACTDSQIRQILISVLREFGLEPVLLEKPDDLGHLLGRQETVIIFAQTRFDKVGYQDILNATDQPGYRVPVVVCSEFYDRDLYMEAMAQGAFDYLATPYRHEEVAWVVNNAVSRNPSREKAHVV